MLVNPRHPQTPVPTRLNLLVTEDSSANDDERMRLALESALASLLASADTNRAAVLLQAEAEFASLLAGRDLRDPSTATLARIIREVLEKARATLDD